MAAKIDRLGVLHALLTEDMIRRLTPERYVDEDGNETYSTAASASEYAAIAKFLKDNEVTADVEKMDALHDLDMLFHKRKKSPTAAEVGEAFIQLDSMKH